MSNPYESARKAVQWGFFFMGVPVGVLVPRLAEIKAGLGAGDASYGSAIAIGGLGAMVGNHIGAQLVHRYGSKPISRTAIVFIMINNVSNALAPTTLWLAIVAFSGGLVWSIQNVGINSQGALVEQGLGRSFMPRAHAFWSIGTMTAAVISSLVAPYLPPLTALSIGVTISLIGFYSLTSNLLPTHLDDRPHNDASQLQQHERIPRGATMFLAAIAFANVMALVPEIAVGDWSSVLLKEDFGVSVGPNGYGFAAFMVFQMLGRLFAPAFVDRYTLANVVRWFGLVGAAGFLTFLLLAARTGADNPDLALVYSCIAYACMGAGVSVMAPAWVTAAGAIPGLPSARAIARIGVIVAVSGMCCRILLAQFSQHFSLPVALSLTGAMLAIAAVMSPVLQPHRAHRHAVTKESA